MVENYINFQEMGSDIPMPLQDLMEQNGQYYLTNAELLKAVIDAKKLGRVTDRLARMLWLITLQYSRKANFISYTWRDDMISAALVNLCAHALKFDPQKSSNPFSFYTTAIHRSFLQYLHDEKKQSTLKDEFWLEPTNNLYPPSREDLASLDKRYS